MFKMRITAPKPVNFGYGFYLSLNQYGMIAINQWLTGIKTCIIKHLKNILALILYASGKKK
ncbi:hypothetical protein PPBDW_II0632 [Photobacterium kishitanii]|nr:hypothetical protein PPBDW_II0632 [Photobacterium kishitanii]